MHEHDGSQATRPLRKALAGALALALLAAPGAVAAKVYTLYAGSYTDGASKGIYAWHFDSADGSLAPLGLQAEAVQPAHIWAAPNGKYLYAVNWEQPGWISAFAVDRRTAKLTLLNRVPSEGDKPNQIVVDPSGRIAVTVNYRSGSIAAFRIQRDGKLSNAFFVERHNPATAMPTPAPAPAPVAKVHGAIFTKDSRHMFVADLGLDRVYSYRVDAARAVITPLDPAYVALHAQSGPRRLQLSADDRFLYVNHETDSEVSVFAIHAGKLTEIQTIATLPAGSAVKNMTSEIVIDPTGRFLYVANRGPDDIAVFAVDKATGRLTARGNVPSGGATPRNLRIDPTGRYLLCGNENGGTITVSASIRAPARSPSPRTPARSTSPADCTSCPDERRKAR